MIRWSVDHISLIFNVLYEIEGGGYKVLCQLEQDFSDNFPGTFQTFQRLCEKTQPISFSARILFGFIMPHYVLFWFHKSDDNLIIWEVAWNHSSLWRRHTTAPGLFSPTFSILQILTNKFIFRKMCSHFKRRRVICMQMFREAISRLKSLLFGCWVNGSTSKMRLHIVAWARPGFWDGFVGWT